MSPGIKIAGWLFSLVCVGCVVGIGFVLFDVIVTGTGSTVNAYGGVAVYVMAVAMAGRYLWGTRQSGR